ncbi:hypothetical protein F0562_004234 [Nyssa sinensis]|uniref:Uncharacterized protein n=1 Tax=Nyssa sinensis TaxID=561372 RepID=A0A5J5BXJ9_9ASTE|nr:hypothetical protein F0562_004234 [Nyssa sinensis]
MIPQSIRKKKQNNGKTSPTPPFSALLQHGELQQAAISVDLALSLPHPHAFSLSTEISFESLCGFDPS